MPITAYQQAADIIVRFATNEEFDKIHHLNHATFAEEIPQHEQKPDGKLIDAFHEKNRYIVALQGAELVGMVCYNPTRPFSLDKKLNDLDKYLPAYSKIVEVRLFAVRKDLRKQGVALSMLKLLIPTLIAEGYDLGVISGSVKELELYKNIGSVPFGPLVGTKDALYQPLYFSINNLKGAFKVDTIKQQANNGC